MDEPRIVMLEMFYREQGAILGRLSVLQPLMQKWPAG